MLKFATRVKTWVMGYEAVGSNLYIDDMGYNF